jgi:hypothetical protein
MNKHALWRPVAALLSLAALAGCTSAELYRTVQGWQQQECLKLKDLDERKRCEASSARSYEQYRAEADAVRSAPPRQP